jgi:hypothetical protein
MAEMVGELRQLQSAAEEPENVNSIELITEELAASCAVFNPYDWDADRISASRELPTGLKIELLADIKQQKVRLILAWRRTGNENRASVRKYITRATAGMVDQLTAAGWKELDRTVEPSAVHYEGEIPADMLRGRISAMADKIDEATGKVRQLSGS